MAYFISYEKLKIMNIYHDFEWTWSFFDVPRQISGVVDFNSSSIIDDGSLRRHKESNNVLVCSGKVLVPWFCVENFELFAGY